MALRFPSAVLQSNTHKRSNFLPFLNIRYSTKSNGFPFSSINKAPQACLSSKSHPEVRPLAHFPPDVWGNPFSSTDFDQSKFELYDRQVKMLKEKTMDMLLASTCNYVENIMLINILCRLGVSYHFEDVIEEQLSHIFHTQPQILNEKEYDLYTVAIVFRIFRQHGFKMSSDVFNKFKDSDGKFKSSLEKDAKGMLSLYEAAHLISLPGEDILDEALTFSKRYLESLALESFPHLRRYIIDALDKPFHYGVPRLEAKKFIHLYQADESPNETLLLFAKFDYNRVQLLHQQELRHFSMWRQGLSLASEFSYARDRTLELFFWGVGLNFEPEYAHSRAIFAKVFSLASLLDDTNDAYATIDEIRLLADAVERWDMSCVDQLPDYMKNIYRLFLNTFSEIEEELKVKEKGYKSEYGKEMFQEIARGLCLEALWRDERKVLSFDEYMQNGYITSGAPLVTVTSFMGAQKIKGTKEFEWLVNEPKLTFVCGAIIRIINDIATYKSEQERGNVVSSIECYMKQYGVVEEEEAIKQLPRMMFDYWKQINEEIMRPTQISVDMLTRTVNAVRLTIATYTYGDGYSNPEQMKKFVQELLIDPISI